MGLAGCTKSKSGWPAQRFFDVIEKGGLPYVVDLNACPQYVLHAAPKALLGRIRAVPFVPPPRVSDSVSPPGPGSMRWELNASSPRYGRLSRGVAPNSAWPSKDGSRLVALQRELHAHARQHLTVAAVARRVVESALGAGALQAWLLDKPRMGSGKINKLLSKSSSGEAMAAAAAANGTSSSRSTSERAATGRRPRVLMLSGGPLDAQATAIRDGLLSLGAHVDLHASSSSASMASMSGRRRNSNYALIVASLGTDGVDSQVAAALNALFLPERNSDKGSAARTQEHAPGAPVACVRGDDSPPPIWQLWVPSFCTLAFVRDMRLR